MHIKNLLIKFFIAFAKPFIQTNTGDRFLIVSTTGLGDTLWGTPAIRALRESYPDAYIAIITTALGKQVLESSPHINEIFVVKEPPLFSLLKLLPILIRKKISKVLVFHISQRPLLPFCALLGAERIIGTEKINKGLDFLLTDKLETKRIHEIERRLEVVQTAGAKVSSKHMEFYSSEDDHRKAKELLPTGLVVGLHPGAKDRFKQWPPSHFIQLGRLLKQKLGCQIVVTGTPAEKSLVESIAGSIEGAIGVYEGVTIPTLAALLDKLSLYITNDTGPLHIACASTTPTIALFAPTDPVLCGPYYAPHVSVLQKKPTCFPCLKKKCNEPFCMLQISTHEVLQTALELLEKNR
ncbi:MAG TPA: glycosyltransferase family 9 protein [Rhabdochlamydiaceae bacterium]|nr:glycosyltransferase family 9 protein [Rhabdochlamydiaceae bacterium]